MLLTRKAILFKIVGFKKKVLGEDQIWSTRCFNIIFKVPAPSNTSDAPGKMAEPSNTRAWKAETAAIRRLQPAWAT